MKNKNTIMFLVAEIIILGVFNAVAFLIPFTRENNFWIGYSFATLAVVLSAAVTVFAIFRGTNKSRFYGISQVIVVLIYTILQTAISLAEMFFSDLPSQYFILVNIIILAGTLLGLIGANMGKGLVEGIDDSVKEKIFFIKSLQGDITSLVSKASDPKLKKRLKDLSETVRFSDPVSNPKLSSIENRIDGKVALLTEEVESQSGKVLELCSELEELFAERNRKCKLLK